MIKYSLTGANQLSIEEYQKWHVNNLQYGGKKAEGMIDKGGFHHETHLSEFSLDDNRNVIGVRILGENEEVDGVVIGISNAIKYSLEENDNDVYARINIVYRNNIDTVLRNKTDTNRNAA